MAVGGSIPGPIPGWARLPNRANIHSHWKKGDAMRTSRLHGVLAVALAGIACSSNTTGSGVQTKFRATLLGANEVPAVTSSAAATAVFTISGNSVTYTLTVNTLPATAIS